MNKLSRNKKRFVLICIDLLMLFVAVLIAMLFMMGFASISLSQIMISYLVVIIVYFVSASRFKIFSVLNRFTDWGWAKTSFRIQKKRVFPQLEILVFPCHGL